MFTKNQFLMGLFLATISPVITFAPANAQRSPVVTDPPPIQNPEFAPDGFNNFSSGTFGGIPVGTGPASSISIPPGMSGAGAGASGTNSGASGSSSGDTTTATTTIGDIAEYFASNIDRSLEDLATPDVAKKPLRIVRRRSTFCPNPSISSRSSERLDELLNQSEQFLEEVKQIDPTNSLW